MIWKQSWWKCCQNAFIDMFVNLHPKLQQMWRTYEFNTLIVMCTGRTSRTSDDLLLLGGAGINRPWINGVQQPKNSFKMLSISLRILVQEIYSNLFIWLKNSYQNESSPANFEEVFETSCSFIIYKSSALQGKEIIHFICYFFNSNAQRS